MYALKSLGQVTYDLFPSGAEEDFITSFFSVVTANIGVVLAIFGVMFAVAWITRRLNKAKGGRV